MPVEGGRPSIRRDRTQCTRGPRGTRRCPRVYPGTLGVYPRTLGFTRGRSGIHGDARVYPGTLCVRGYARGRSGLPADARVYPGPLRRPGDARGIPGDARVHPGTLGFTRGPRGISGDPWVYPGTPDVRYARAKSSLPGPGEGRFRPSWARFGGSPGAGGGKKAHRSAKHTLCFAIVPPGRKSVFRAGFRPDSDRESFKIGTPAGRRPAGHKYCLVFV